MAKQKKANRIKCTLEFLESRVSPKYGEQKWITFCKTCIKEGYTCYLYEAKETVSKYITVINQDSTKKYKVRFSNHKPAFIKEEAQDCDFFVGVTNHKITTTNQALKATFDYMKGELPYDTTRSL